MTREGQALVLTVRNMGSSDLPPYKISIFSPGRGHFSFFEEDDAGQLIPGAERQHRVPLDSDRLAQMIPRWITDSLFPETPKPATFVYHFRLIMRDGRDVILYEDKRLGASLMRTLAQAYMKDRFNPAMFPGAGELRSLTWRTRWRRQREYRRLLRRSKSRPASPLPAAPNPRDGLPN